MSMTFHFIVSLFMSLHLLSPHIDIFIENYGFYVTFLIIFSCFLSSFWMSFIDFILATAIYLGIFYVFSIYSSTALVVFCLLSFFASLIGIGYLFHRDKCDNKLSMFLHFFIISIILLLVDLKFCTMSIPFFKIACVIIPLVLFHFWRFYSVLICAHKKRLEIKQAKK